MMKKSMTNKLFALMLIGATSAAVALPSTAVAQGSAATQTQTEALIAKLEGLLAELNKLPADATLSNDQIGLMNQYVADSLNIVTQLNTDQLMSVEGFSTINNGVNSTDTQSNPSATGVESGTTDQGTAGSAGFNAATGEPAPAPDLM